MASSTTIAGLPYPTAGDSVNVAGDIQSLAAAVDGTTVRKLTQVQIDALSGAQKPAGLLVFNSTAGKLQISDGSTFADVGPRYAPQRVTRTSNAGLGTVLTASSITADGTTSFRVSWSIPGVYANAAGDVVTLQCKAGSTVIAQTYVYVAVGSNTAHAGFSGYVIDTPAAGSVVYSLTLARSSGGNTDGVYAAADAPATLTVEQWSR